MMKKIIFVLMICIFLLGCKAKEGSVGPEYVDYKTGINGLDINFIKGQPIDEIWQDSEILVGIEIQNKGGYRIEEGKLNLEVKESFFKGLKGFMIYATILCTIITLGLFIWYLNHSTLQKAQAEAQLGKAGSVFGVYILPGAYVLYQGETYAGRSESEDETFSYASAMTLSGITDITFTKRDGLPSATGTILLTLGDDVQIITIGSFGTIE